jgi:hypothetical protein
MDSKLKKQVQNSVAKAIFRYTNMDWAVRVAPYIEGGHKLKPIPRFLDGIGKPRL